jgi:hypothetical protein
VTSDAALFGATLWRKRERAQLARLFRHWAAALVSDGSLAGLEDRSTRTTPVLHLLGHFVGLPTRDPAARLVRGLFQGRSVSAPNGRSRRAGAPGCQSDSGRFAHLRNHWGSDAAVCSLRYPGREIEIDASIAGERLFRGAWTTELVIGERQVPVKPWKCECWFSDRDADFVELSADLGQGATFVRQVLLGRREDVLVIAEAVRGVDADQRVILQSRLPVSTRLRPESDGLTREIQIPLPSRRVRVFPVHLPWERAAAADGACRVDDDELVLEVAGSGSRCQVLVLGWSDPDGRQPADAAPLTVCEDLRRLGASDACAGRVRVGTRQWIYLHNLTTGAVPRSVLGLHTASETVIGRVARSGRVKFLVHVEGRTAAADAR